MICDEIKQQLSAYLDHELADEQHRDIHRHLAHCPSCQAELERLTRTSVCIQAWEMPQLQTNVWEAVLATVNQKNQSASFQVLTRLFGILGLLTFAAITLVLISAFGQTVLALWRAIGRNLVNLFSLIPKLASRGPIGMPAWPITLGLFLAFLLSGWLFRKVLTNSSFGGPLHE